MAWVLGTWWPETMFSTPSCSISCLHYIWNRIRLFYFKFTGDPLNIILSLLGVVKAFRSYNEYQSGVPSTKGFSRNVGSGNSIKGPNPKNGGKNAHTRDWTGDQSVMVSTLWIRCIIRAEHSTTELCELIMICGKLKWIITISEKLSGYLHKNLSI